MTTELSYLSKCLVNSLLNKDMIIGVTTAIISPMAHFTGIYNM